MSVQEGSKRRRSVAYSRIKKQALEPDTPTAAEVDAVTEGELQPESAA
jgi:hypothetical protein